MVKAEASTQSSGLTSGDFQKSSDFPPPAMASEVTYRGVVLSSMGNKDKSLLWRWDGGLGLLISH